MQIANIAISSIIGIFFLGTLFRSIESFEGDPPFPEDEHTAVDLEMPRNKWTFFASVYFIFVTASTVGYGDMSPKSIPGQLFVIVIIMAGICGFSFICGEIADALALSSSGQGAYPAKKKTRHIIVTGTPNAQMIGDFLKEVYHDDHKTENGNLEVVMLVSSHGSLMDALQSFLKRKSNAHIQSHVTVLQGSVLDPSDLLRARFYAASAIFVLPNLYTSNPVQDDTENIMRVMSIRRDTPRVRIITLLHKAENRQLLLSSGAAESDVICIDEFKLGLLGKTCQIVGFAPLVCNLCKTIGEEDDKDLEDWLKFYSSCLGNELYEVQLSVAYCNRRFADVVLDVLRRSDGKVYLIGVIEGTGPGALLRVNPGQSYAIRDDRRSCGIFIAADRESIIQQSTGQQSQREMSSDRAGSAQPQQGVTQPGSSPSAMPDLIQDTAASRDRAKRVAAKHVAQRLWQRRLLPRQDIEELLNVKLHEEDLDPELTEMNCEDDVIAEARTLLQEVRQLDLVDQGDAAAPGSTTSTQVQDRSQQHHFESLRLGFEEMSMPKEPPPSLLAKGGHILFCTLDRGEKTQELGKRLGFEHFLKPLRSSLIQQPRPIVVLAPKIPADWYTCAAFTDVYFIEGSPISSFHLSRTSFELAHIIVVHQPGTADGVNDPMMVDSDVIFCARLIEGQLPQMGYRPQVVVDLMFDANYTFVPLESESRNEAGGGDDTSVEQQVRRTEKDLIRAAGTRKEMAVQHPTIKIRRRHSMGKKATSPKAQPDAEKIDELGQQIEETGFYKQPRFACGTLFVSSTVTSLVVNAMYNPSLALLVKELISAHFLLVTVPVECHGWQYQKFFEHLLRDRDLMSLAIVRQTDAVVPAEDDDFVPAPPDERKKMARGKEGAQHHRYVQTAPAANARIVFNDQILCVPPNTNDCAVKNILSATCHIGPVV